MYSKNNARQSPVYHLTLICVLLSSSALIAYKLLWLDYPVAGLIPAVSYEVNIGMEVDGHGNDIRVSTFLPLSDARQIISDESNVSGMFSNSVTQEGLNRLSEWSAERVTGVQLIRYTYSVQATHVRYEIPGNLAIPTTYAAELQPYLNEESGIQVFSPLIQQRIDELLLANTTNVLDVLTRIHRHLQDDFKNRNFSGYTDALTALALGEASCNGKGRLFVAIARKLNLPARLVGGLVLQQGRKRTSHQWVEVFINGYWVPFDTINNHFAELPAHYLTLYYGDEALFKHTTDINFQYAFTTLKRLVPQREAQRVLNDSPLAIINIYELFERVGISQNLLKILLMIPFGALVTVIFRNVIGLETFGTFLPALIAAASRETGLAWGMVGFVFIIFLVSWLRKFLDWLQLLHSPKMAILLTVVVIVFLIIAIVGVNAGLFELAHITLFPIAILAITAERIAILEAEQGWQQVGRITVATLVVIAACYVVMDSLFLQSLVLAFPEVLLLLIAANLWLGRWVGMRMSELIRFRQLIFVGSRP